MKAKQYQVAVNQTEILLGRMKLSREEILCVLARVTANAIHVIEERALRTRVELAYIDALRLMSETEENGQDYFPGKSPKHHDDFVDKLIQEVSDVQNMLWDKV